ncbi:MAG: tetratricopeptide repeat protein, partial [bacterium]
MQKSVKEEIKFLQGKLDKNEDSVLFARLADAHLQMDRVDEAIELCENGIKKHPFYVTGHYVLGKCYLKKKMFDQAEKELKRVLLFDPKYIAAHRDYGELMAQIGWNNTCEMSYEEIVRIDPLNEKAKKRLEELREQSALTREEQPEEQSEMELEEVEEDILTGLSPAAEQVPEMTPEEAPEVTPEITPEEEFEEVDSDAGTADS